MEKVLVTGATGFIGPHLIVLLMQAGFAVRALVRDLNRTIVWPPGVEFFIGDITQAETLQGCCANVTTVFHLAGFAHASPLQTEQFSKKHHMINFCGTEALLQEAIKAKVNKFIYISSVKAVADAKHRVDEQWDTPPNNPYGLSKRAAELAVLTTGKLHGLHTTVLRPALVYGPGWKGNLAQMLRAVDRGRFLPIPQIKQDRSMVGVADLCRAAILAAKEEIASGKIYFVTDNISYTSHGIYHAMLRALGKPRPKWTVPYHVFKYLAKIGDILERQFQRNIPFNSEKLDKLFGTAAYSSRRIESELHFSPQDTFETLLPSIVSHYRKEED